MATHAAAAADAAAGNLIASLGQIGGGGPKTHDELVQLLLENMPKLTEYAKQGKLNETQMNQVFSRLAIDFTSLPHSMLFYPP